MEDYFFDDWGGGSDYSSDFTLDTLPSADYGSMLPGDFYFDDWASPVSDMNWASAGTGFGVDAPFPDNGSMDLRALLPNSWADALSSPTGKSLMQYAPLAAGALSYFQQRPMYKAAEDKMKRDMEWEEEQRRRQRMKQAESDKYFYPDPAASAAIGSIASNRGNYTGYAATPGYRVTGSGVQRQPFFAAEGGSLPGGYKTGPLNFLRYLIAGKKFPWENEQSQPAPQPAAVTEYAGGEQRRRRLQELEDEAVGKAKGGPLQRMRQGTYLRSSTKGQDDVIPVAAAGGEYVLDADSVSALGDGNNEAGAAVLDNMRVNLRKHKRSAPPDKIPPKAKRPEQYMKKEK